LPISATICRRKRRLSPKTATVAEFGDCCQKRRLSPNGLSTLATTVAQFRDCCQNRRLLPNSRRFWRQSATVNHRLHSAANCIDLCTVWSGRQTTTVVNTGQRFASFCLLTYYDVGSYRPSYAQSPTSVLVDTRWRLGTNCSPATAPSVPRRLLL